MAETSGADARRVVGQVGRPHGLRGEVTVQVHTDFPEQRFAVGAQLHGDTGRMFTVETVRSHRGVLLVRFAGITDREAAAELRGRTLSVDAAELPDLTDPDEFYDHQLEGLAAVGPDGVTLGRVREVVHAPASDLLVLDTAHGEVLVPFVQAIVPEVDLAAGRVVLNPPAGLLD
ncbi:MAG TPA: ribosome maturation factor RimM [Pseudonocardiaceae bacterium]|nr:ribosome maturation factor RimM [Pseudonocardiaceae bacterium]